MPSRHATQVAELFRHQESRLRAALRRAFPNICLGRVEDAISNAFLEVLEHPNLLESITLSNEATAFCLLYRIAWCDLRGQWRRRSYQLELSLAPTEGAAARDVAGPHSADDLVVTRRLLARVEQLIEQAGAMFSRHAPERLSGALRARLDGLTDGQAAKAWGVRREPVNRARLWFMETLAAELGLRLDPREAKHDVRADDLGCAAAPASRADRRQPRRQRRAARGGPWAGGEAARDLVLRQ